MDFKAESVKFKKFALSGSTLIEYSLIGSGILATCIIGIVGFSGSLNGLFDFLIEDMKEHSERPQVQLAKVESAIALQQKIKQESLNKTPIQLDAKPLKKSVSDVNSLCASTWCVSAPGLTGDSVYTAGSNGSKMVDLTNTSASVFAQITQIMQEQNVDPATLGLLTRMANTGHQMGDAQQMFLNDSAHYEEMYAGIKEMETSLVEFKQTTKELKAVMGKLPPESRGILQDAANVIIGVGDSYEFREKGNRIGYSYSSSKIALTHNKSNTICQNGGDTSQCVKKGNEKKKKIPISN